MTLSTRSSPDSSPVLKWLKEVVDSLTIRIGEKQQTIPVLREICPDGFFFLKLSSSCLLKIAIYLIDNHDLVLFKVVGVPRG